MAKKSLRDIMNEKSDELGKNFSYKQKQQINNLKKDTNKYTGMNKNQLMNELIKMQQGKSGINEKSLNEFKNFVLPLLDENGKRQLSSIVDQIKK